MYVCFEGTGISLLDIEQIGPVQTFSEDDILNIYGGTTKYRKTGIRFTVTYKNQQQIHIQGQEEELTQQRQSLIAAWQQSQTGE